MGGQDRHAWKVRAVKVQAFRHPPPACDALWYALRMQRQVEPKSWLAALEQVPEHFRDDVETYLRGIARRMRVVNAINSNS